MSQKLLDVLMLGRCAHEFSWPRRAADGSYYQVCLVCAAEYKYDWKTMRRIERMDAAPAEPATKRRSHTKKPTWVPRARRLKLDTPVRYRVKNLGTWSEEQQCAVPGAADPLEGNAGQRGWFRPGSRHSRLQVHPSQLAGARCRRT